MRKVPYQKSNLKVETCVDGMRIELETGHLARAVARGNHFSIPFRGGGS